jgi:HNH endonuclease
MTAWVCEWCGEAFDRRGTTPRRFCSRAHADQWTQRDKPSAEWLTQKYVTEGLTCVDIALIVERHPKRVWEWMRQAGIPTRPRGSYNTEMFLGKPSANKGRVHTPESIANITAGRRKVPRESYAGNGHYLRDHKGPAHPNWKGGATPERQGFYSTPEWKLIARDVWVRDKSTCQRCGVRPPRKGPKHNRGHVHHVVSFQVRELRSEMSNLILLCADCHRWIHSKANTEQEYIG